MFQKNKFRQGYKKVVATLDSCESWEQFAYWDRLAKNFFDMVNFHIELLNRRTMVRFWHRKEFRRWISEVQWMGNDITQRRQAFYDYNKHREEEAHKKMSEKEKTVREPKPPAVVTGFVNSPAKKKRTYVKRSKN